MLNRTARTHSPTNWLGMLFVLALLVSPAFAVTEIGYRDDQGGTTRVSSSTPLPTTINGTVTATLDDALVSTLSVMLAGPTGFATDPTYIRDYRGSVASPSQHSTSLATGTPTSLQSICSWTVPCSLQIQVNNVAFYGPATTTAATVFNGQRMAQWDTLWITPSSNLYNLSFIASTSAAASISIAVHPLVP